MVGSDWTNIFNKTLAFGAIALLVLIFFSIIGFGRFGIYRDDLFIIFGGVLLVVSISLIIGLIAESPIMIQFENSNGKRKVIVAFSLAILGMVLGAVLATGMTLLYRFIASREFFLFLLETDPIYLLFDVIQDASIGTLIGAVIGGAWTWMRLY